MPRMTTAELDAYNARQRKPNKLLVDLGLEVGPIKSTRESVLHRQILHECSRRGFVALHGAMHRKTARTAGEWDFVILLPDGRTIHVEAKTGSGKLSDDQERLHGKAWELGHTVYVVRSLEDLKSVLRDLNVKGNP